MALSGSISVGINLRKTTSAELGSAPWSMTAAWAKTLTDGTGLNQANKVVAEKVTLAGSGTVTYDLDSGALSDPSGVSGGVVAAITRVVALAVRRTGAPAASTQDEDVHLKGSFITTLLGNAGAALPIGPGGMFVYVFPAAEGVVVTPSTGDQLTLENMSTTDSVELEVILVGS
jgi:hypothetical protein